MHMVLRLAQLIWTDHVIRMHDGDFRRNFSMENYRREGARMCKVAKDILKASLKDFEISKNTHVLKIVRLQPYSKQCFII